MTFGALIVALLLLGIGLYLIKLCTFLEPPIPLIIRVLLILGFVLWVLDRVGLLNTGALIHV